jgi:hypothetical protein
MGITCTAAIFTASSRDGVIPGLMQPPSSTDIAVSRCRILSMSLEI